MKIVNVLQVVFNLGIGGMERVIQTLCNKLDKSRYKIHIFSLTNKGIIGEELENDGFAINYTDDKSIICKYFRFIDLAKFIKSNNIDILHTHNTGALLDGFLAKFLTEIPIFIHTDHCKKYPAPLKYVIAENIASRYCDKTVAVSKHTKNDLIKHEGILEDNIIVIYNGIDKNNFNNEKDLSNLRHKLGIREDEFIIGSVGRLTEQKGYDLFLKVAMEYNNRMENVKYIIVGGGVKEEELRKMAEDMGLNGKIYFTGWCTEAIKYLQLFDIFLMTSNWEGLPIVLLEAMAYGIPIVSVNVGGVNEIIINNINGFISKNKDPHEISDIIYNILSNTELYDKISNNSNKIYNNKFTSNEMVKEYQILYEKMLSEKNII